MNGFTDTVDGFDILNIQALQTMADSIYISGGVTDYSGVYTETEILNAITLKDQPGKWADEWANLKSEADGALGWTPQQAKASYGRTLDGNDSTNNDAVRNDLWRDMKRANCLALAYRLTDQQDYGVKAVDIVNAWVNSTDGLNSVIPANVQGDWQTPRATVEAILGRYLPNMMEIASLLRSTSVWDIDTDFDAFIQDIIIPEAVHGQNGGDYDLGYMPESNNHGTPSLFLGFQCNFYTESGETEYQNVLNAFKYHLDTRDMTSYPDGLGGYIKAGMATMLVGSDLEGTTSTAVRTQSAIFPIEMWRSDSDGYTMIEINYTNAICRLLYSYGKGNYWEYENDVGATFEQLLINHFNMRLSSQGGTETWVHADQSGPSYDEYHWVTAFSNTPLPLLSKYPNWVTWGDTNRSSFSSYDSMLAGVFWTIAPVLFGDAT